MTGYFKVITTSNRPNPSLFFCFDESDTDSLTRAWWGAKQLAKKMEGKMATYKKLETPGPWSILPVVGDGIDGMALTAFAEGTFSDDGDGASN